MKAVHRCPILQRELQEYDWNEWMTHPVCLKLLLDISYSQMENLYLITENTPELMLCIRIIQLFHFIITRWRSRWRSEQFGPVCCSGGGHGPGRPRNPLTERGHYKHLAWSWGDPTTPWWAPPHTYSPWCWTTSVQGPHSSICKLDSTQLHDQLCDSKE
jgi:hypothetical protein